MTFFSRFVDKLLKTEDMNKLVLLIVSSVLLMVSCKTNDNVVKMTVASEKRMAMGVAPMEVLLVKEGDAQEWSFFYSNIEGFSHENGYEYVLDVKKENIENATPADASSIKYTLVKEVSKTQKNSEAMPEDIVKDKFVWTAKVIEITSADAGKGAAVGKFPVQIVKLEVTALNSKTDAFKEGDTIYAELVTSPNITPVVEREYVFKSKNVHPAHALGTYMLETNLQDLTY